MMKLSTLKKLAMSLIIAIGLSTSATAQNDSLLYHDHSFESAFYNSLDSNWAQYLVRVTPTAYPAQLCGIRAWFKDPSDVDQRIRFTAYKDLTGAGSGCGTSAAIYTSPNRIPVPVTTLATLYEDMTSSNIQIATGDYYAGVSQTKKGSSIALDTDTLPNYYKRQWYRTSVFGFVNWAYHNTNFGSYGQYGITVYWKHITTGVDDVEPFTDNITIMPNPASTNTDIYWFLPNSAKVTVGLYNLVGQLEMTLVDGVSMNSGEQHINLDLTNVSNGIYLCRFDVDGVIVTKKITVSH